MITEQVRQAMGFAMKAHMGQVRKYSGAPYFTHPLSVMQIVSENSNPTEPMLIASLLHDVVEDTEISLDAIDISFGAEVRELVWWLTDPSEPSDGNRAVRKAMDREHLARAPYEAQTIKYADLIDNTQDIKANDLGFWGVYREEKRQLLEVMNQGCAKLYGMAQQQLI